MYSYHSYISWVNTSASDTALSADLQNLYVNSTSAFNTPSSGTPIPTTSVSSETTALLVRECSQQAQGASL